MTEVLKIQKSTGNINLKSDAEKIREFLNLPNGNRDTDTLNIIVSGYREFNSYDVISQGVRTLLYATKDYSPTFIVGDCRGVDFTVVQIAESGNFPCQVFYANWEDDWKAAGPIRNKSMIEHAKRKEHSVLLAFDHEKSRGTKDMIDQATKAGIKAIVIDVTN